MENLRKNVLVRFVLVILCTTQSAEKSNVFDSNNQNSRKKIIVEPQLQIDFKLKS